MNTSDSESSRPESPAAQVERGATRSNPLRAVWLLFPVVLVLASTIVLLNCGKSGSDHSPISPSVNTTWPVVAVPSLGVSIAYPPQLTPATLNSFQVSFSTDEVNVETDNVFPIVFSVYPGTTAEQRDEIRGTFNALNSDGLERLGSFDVVRIVGLLKPDIFGWGGSVHGYLIFELQGRVVVVDYDAEDQTVVQSVNQMIELITPGS